MNNLLPQQEKALAHRSEWKVGALFMKMGTGKTRVTVELVNQVADLDLVVYVAPLRIIQPKEPNIPKISDEVQKWGGFNAKEVIYIGVETIGQSDRQFLQLFKKISTTWKSFLVVDESIKIKNIEAKRTKRLLQLSEMVEYKLILNGEPVTRDLLDLYPQMNFLDPRILRMSLPEFKNTFCKYTTVTKRFGGYKEYSKEFITGYENIDYLYSLIGQYVFECDLDLQIQQIYEDVSYSISDEDKQEYYRLKTEYLDDEKLMMMNNNIFLELTQKMQYGYCCSEEKFEAVKEWFGKYPEEKSIIFVKYIRSMEECKRRFPKATVLNYKTGSYGLNLQHLPYTVYFDKTWDYGDIAQSKHRNYRVGQEQDCRYLSLTGDVGLETLISENNKKKIGVSEYLKKISREQLREVL
ncbi:SNF2-related protein [Capnocytophaga canimorsus]|uniref:SNF2-related protein n=1 Tax=Capnocytophaga canimorsus TaxID=28188 RepID=UPI0037CF4191